jgi:hypothetical protein
MRVCKYRPICKIEDLVDLPEKSNEWKEKYCWKKMKDCILFSKYEEFTKIKEAMKDAGRSLGEILGGYVGEIYFESTTKKFQDVIKKTLREISEKT